MPHFEQAPVARCRPGDPLEVTRFDYPWIGSEATAIATALVVLGDGTEFRFGSMIGLNHTLESIADSVPAASSKSTQAMPFRGLPSVLQGRRITGINKAAKSESPRGPLFIASRNLITAAGLVVAIRPPEGESDLPTVLRAGISTANQRPRLLRVMGIVQVNHSQRE